MIYKYYNLYKKIFSKFALVGIIGIIVNQGLLALFVNIGLSLNISSIIAIETSILNNFFFNNFWTWKKGLESGFFNRFIKYHLVTLVSGLINYFILIELTGLGINYLIANLIGITAGMAINFLLNLLWTFK